MLRMEPSFVCSSCDICHSEKVASLMCTLIADGYDDTSSIEEVCWCVCKDCLSLIEKVSSYFEDVIH